MSFFSLEGRGTDWGDGDSHAFLAAGLDKPAKITNKAPISASAKRPAQAWIVNLLLNKEIPITARPLKVDWIVNAHTQE